MIHFFTKTGVAMKTSLMSFLPNTLLGLTACGLLLAGSAVAQERSASGATNMQMTWTALNALVGSATTKANAVNDRVQSVINCNWQSKAYNGSGCVDNAKLVPLSAKIDTIKSNITAINSQIDTANKTLKDMNTSIDSLQTNVNILNSQIAALQAAANTLSTQQAGTIAKINALATQTTTVLAQINDLVGRVNTHTGQIADLYNKVAAANTSIANLNSQIAGMNSSLSSVNSSVSGMNNSLANVLYCGSLNYIYNYNAGCVIPTGHTSCSLHQYATGNTLNNGTVTSNSCAGGITVTTGGGVQTVHSGSGGHGGSDTDYYVFSYACYSISCP